jgi:RNA polymerase sigma factor (sigma-70 family)
MILCKQIHNGKYNQEYELAAFLYVICKNLWTNKIKREKRISYLPENYDIDDKFDFSDHIVTKEKKQVLNEIIEKLGGKCYQLLQYSIFFKYKPDEIIAKMGFASVNAVKTQKYKCKQKLSQILEEKNIYKEVLD